jgi:hypothetical protein
MKTATNYIGSLVKTAVVILSIAGFASCQKSKEDKSPTAMAEGYWKGTYTATGVPGYPKVHVLIKPGGFARVYALGNNTDTTGLDPELKTDATWMLSDHTLDVMYNTGISVLLSGVIDPDAQTWKGQLFNNAVLKGTISLKK